MPLEPGSAREIVAHNIAAEIRAGRSPAQAAAIAYRTAEESDDGIGRFYSQESIGATRHLTPEGFLICVGAPVARTGEMIYGPGETEIEPSRDGLVRIQRDESVVFDPTAMRSFEGKPVTDDHPPEEVTPENWRKYAIGHVQNVRRGEGRDGHLLIADLLIMDGDAIGAVLSGKREISCGYDAEYEQIEPGLGRQTRITGNHVALVDSARCGPQCAIRDHKTMPNKAAVVPPAKKSWMDRMRAVFMARDSEEFEKALAEVPAEEKKDEESSEGESGGNSQSGQHHVTVNIHPPGSTAEKEVEKEAKAEDEEGGGSDFEKTVLASLKDICARLDKLEGGDDSSEGEGEGEGETTTNTGDSESEEETEEEKKEREKQAQDAARAKGKAKDSAAKFQREEFQRIVALADIIAPGIQAPTFDAKLDRKKVADSLCVLSRRALGAAWATDAGKKAIAEMSGSDARPNFGQMTCDAAAIMFNGVGAKMKALNNDASRGKGKTDDASTSKGPVAASELNKIHSDFWSKHKNG